MEDDLRKENENGRRPKFLLLENQNDDLKKNGRLPKQWKMTKKMEDDLKKMENNLNKNGRQPKQKWQMT